MGQENASDNLARVYGIAYHSPIDVLEILPEDYNIEFSNTCERIPTTNANIVFCFDHVARLSDRLIKVLDADENGDPVGLNRISLLSLIKR
jgi:hypothetical protein